MRTIEPTGQFKRDYKREAKGPHRQTLIGDFACDGLIWTNSAGLSLQSLTREVEQAFLNTDDPNTTFYTNVVIDNGTFPLASS